MSFPLKFCKTLGAIMKFFDIEKIQFDADLPYFETFRFRSFDFFSFDSDYVISFLRYSVRLKLIKNSN